MAIEEEDDQRTTPGKEIWRRRCGQQDTSVAGMKTEVAAQNRAGMEKSDQCVKYATLACSGKAEVESSKSSFLI